MKRALKWVGGILGVLVLVVASFWFYAFGSNKTVTEGPIVPGVETVKDGIANLFFVDAGPGKLVFIDAGNDKSGKAVLAALGKRGLTPAAVAAIFLTHGHPDHMATAHLFPAADVYAMETELPLIGDAVKVTHPLKDGEIVKVGDLQVEAFATPGHTAGSAVYLAKGVLFFGDSAGANKDGEIMKAVGLFSKDSAQNIASLKALSARLEPRKAEIKAMAFGHTGSVEGLAPLEAFAAKH
jgi:glyoxylase-like metal-dependent hydrolase (beta-lactamase superfamily II)